MRQQSYCSLGLTDEVCQAFSCGVGKREEALKTSGREAAAKPVM